MSSININTDIIKNNIDNLNSEKSYYSNKKNYFSSGNFNSTSYVTSYLSEIQGIYDDISNNINNVISFLEDYTNDVENVEKVMSGLGGLIKSPSVNSIVNNYKNTIVNNLITDENIFVIKEFSASSNKLNVTNWSTDSTGVAGVADIAIDSPDFSELATYNGRENKIDTTTNNGENINVNNTSSFNSIHNNKTTDYASFNVFQNSSFEKSNTNSQNTSTKLNNGNSGTNNKNVTNWSTDSTGVAGVTDMANNSPDLSELATYNGRENKIDTTTNNGENINVDSTNSFNSIRNNKTTDYANFNTFQNNSFEKSNTNNQNTSTKLNNGNSGSSQNVNSIGNSSILGSIAMGLGASFLNGSNTEFDISESGISNKEVSNADASSYLNLGSGSGGTLRGGSNAKKRNSSAQNQTRRRQGSAGVQSGVPSFTSEDGGMVFDFLTGTFIPVGVDPVEYTASLTAVDLLARFGFTEKEIMQITQADDFNDIINSILNGKLENDEEREKLYETVMLLRYAGYFSEFNDDFSNLDELKAAITDLDAEIAKVQTQRDQYGMNLKALLKAIDNYNYWGEPLNDDTVVLYVYSGPDNKVFYTTNDPSVFISVPDGELDGVNFSEYQNYTLDEPKKITLKEILDNCDSDLATEFRNVCMTDEPSGSSRDLSAKITDLENNINTSSYVETLKSLVDQRNDYQYVYDAVKDKAEYNINYIDPYTFSDDYQDNIGITSDSRKILLDYIEELKSNSELDLTTGETYTSMGATDYEGAAKFLYAYYNDEYDLKYQNGLLYLGNSVITTANLNFSLTDYCKYKNVLTDEEKTTYNYIFNTKGAEAAWEWLGNIHETLDARYLATEMSKDAAWAEEHPVQATLASFIPSDAVNSTFKLLGCVLSGQDIQQSYTYDKFAEYKNTVTSAVAKDYGDGWGTVYNIVTSGVEEGTWAAIHFASGGTTVALKSALSFSKGFPSYVGEAKQRGYSDWESIIYGGACSAADFVTEYWSGSKLLGINNLDDGVIKPWIANRFGTKIATIYSFGGQTLFEDEEEVGSNYLSRIIDDITADAFNHKSQKDIDLEYYEPIYGREGAIKKVSDDRRKEDIDTIIQTSFSSIFSSGTYSYLDRSAKNYSSRKARSFTGSLNTTSGFNNQSTSSNPGIALKETVLARTSDITDPKLKIRAIYMELNKRLHYNIDYMIDQDNNDLRQSIYGQELTFADMTSDQVICKEWSELFREVLIDAGIDPNKITIQGSNKVGAHKWVEIDIGKEIIIADATEAIHHNAPDLDTSKAGLSSNGFAIVNKGYSGSRLSSVWNNIDSNADSNESKQVGAALKRSNKTVSKWDQRLGYVDRKGGYYSDSIQAAQDVFGKETIAKTDIDSFMQKLFDAEIPNDMNGFELYTYFEKMLGNINSENSDYRFTLNRMYRETDSGYECVLLITTNLENGERMGYAYSDSLGKQKLNSASEINDFLGENRVLHYKDMMDHAKRKRLQPIENVENSEESLSKTQKIEEVGEITEKIDEAIEEVQEHTEKLDDVIEGVQNIEEQSETESKNTNPNSIEARIVDSVGDSDAFEAVMNEIGKYNDNNLPEGYSSVQELRQAIFDALVANDKISSLTNFELECLIEGNPDMIERLIGTERFNRFIIENITTVTGFYAKEFSKLSPDALNEIFNTPAIKEYISSLSAKDFMNIFNEFANRKCNLAAVDTMRDILLSFSLTELNENGLLASNIIAILRNNNNENGMSIAKKLLTDMKSDDIDNADLGYIYDIINSFPKTGVYENYSDQINDIRASIKNRLMGILASNSQIEIPDNVDNDGWYILKYKVNGKEVNKEFYASKRSGFDIFNLLYDYDAIARGEIEILGIEFNAVKTALELKNLSQNGLTVFKLEIDGKIVTIVGEVEWGSCDLTKYLNTDNIEEARVLEIKPMEKASYNIEVPSLNSLYKISYVVDGVTYTDYVTPRKKGKNIVLDLNQYIMQKGLTSFSDLEASPVEVTPELLKGLDISRFSGSEEVFRKGAYGGNQSNISDLVVSSLNGETLSETDSRKANEMIDLIKKYYPNAKPDQIKNIAEECTKHGCGYVAIANSFVTYMNGLENGGEIFRDKMGYDLYYLDGDGKSLNTELLALDIFLNGSKNLYGNDTADKAIENSGGVNRADYKLILDSYFPSRGINIESANATSVTDNLLNKVASSALSDPNVFTLLMASDFDLQNVNGDAGTLNADSALANAKVEGKIYKGVDSHAMSIVGVSESGNLLVSSWGSEYEFLPGINTNNVGIFTVKFSIGG